MPLQKMRSSKSARDQRRTHWKLTAPNFSDCPRCHEPRLPHHVCTSCGFYEGRKVLDIKEKTAKA